MKNYMYIKKNNLIWKKKSTGKNFDYYKYCCNLKACLHRCGTQTRWVITQVCTLTITAPDNVWFFFKFLFLFLVMIPCFFWFCTFMLGYIQYTNHFFSLEAICFISLWYQSSVLIYWYFYYSLFLTIILRCCI